MKIIGVRYVCEAEGKCLVCEIPAKERRFSDAKKSEDLCLVASVLVKKRRRCLPRVWVRINVITILTLVHLSPGSV